MARVIITPGRFATAPRPPYRSGGIPSRRQPRRVLQPVSKADRLRDQHGRALKRVTTLEKEELATTVHHRTLKRNVSYEELVHLEALKIVRMCLEDKPYKPFRPWW
ncbi:hypothetical protein ACWGDX_17375 [Streptomyces sp. NPDC055025]